VSVTQVIMPKLGLTMDEGRLVGWLKAEGDRVEAGEVLFEVETDKATMEVESPVAGYVRRLLAAVGDDVPVTRVIALISTTADEPLTSPPADGATDEQAPATATGPVAASGSVAASALEAGAGSVAASALGAGAPPAEVPSGAPTPAFAAAAGSVGAPGERVVASPAARKRAAELGVDLARVRPARGDRIAVEDVEAAHAAGGTGLAAGTAPATAPAATPVALGAAAASAATAVAGGAAPTAAATADRVPLSRMRRAIAERMTQSFRDVPQFSVARDVDMTAAGIARAAAGVSYADVLIQAVALALVDHPRLAMRFDLEGLIAGAGINIGIAVALEDGLLVPVLHDADRKDLAAISRERSALQDGARAGKLTVEALSGAALTISNLGQHGVDRFTAIVNPPEAAILAVGRIRDQVVARDGAPAVAPVVTLTLSVDHRVVDGAEAASFLADLASRLEGEHGD
jgi:pyruvate dehydrogenase E2 component (dihydrolipoamide acetyltransferase)